MKQGILIFAHNNREVDFLRLAIISGRLAKKNLGKSVSLVTDEHTKQWMVDDDLEDTVREIFDNVIVTEKPSEDNFRTLNDGASAKTVPFANKNRYSAYNLSPYDQTLVIDSDLLILSDKLNKYWNVDTDLSICKSNVHIKDDFKYLDNFVSDTGPKMFWATAFMFKKTDKAKSFFGLVDYIRENYLDFASIYGFVPNTFRNDVAFSIAKHMFEGFIENENFSLPEIMCTVDKDVLYDIDNGMLKFLISNNDSYYVTSFKDIDIHVMNKQSLIRNFDGLINL